MHSLTLLFSLRTSFSSFDRFSFLCLLQVESNRLNSLFQIRESRKNKKLPIQGPKGSSAFPLLGKPGSSVPSVSLPAGRSLPADFTTAPPCPGTKFWGVFRVKSIRIIFCVVFLLAEPAERQLNTGPGVFSSTNRHQLIEKDRSYKVKAIKSTTI